MRTMKYLINLERQTKCRIYWDINIQHVIQSISFSYHAVRQWSWPSWWCSRCSASWWANAFAKVFITTVSLIFKSFCKPLSRISCLLTSLSGRPCLKISLSENPCGKISLSWISCLFTPLSEMPCLKMHWKRRKKSKLKNPVAMRRWGRNLQQNETDWQSRRYGGRRQIDTTR